MLAPSFACMGIFAHHGSIFGGWLCQLQVSVWLSVRGLNHADTLHRRYVVAEPLGQRLLIDFSEHLNRFKHT